MRTSKLILGTFFAAFTLPACGIEGLFNNAAADQYERPVTRITGPITAVDAPTFKVLKGDDSAVEMLSSGVKNGTYTITLPSASYQNLRVEAAQGEVRLLGVVPSAEPESTVTSSLTAGSTAIALVIAASLTAESKSLLVVTPGLVRGLARSMTRAFETTGPAKDLVTMVDRLITAAKKDASPANVMFVDPVYSASLAVVTSAINGAWLTAANVDYTGDGTADATSAAFDAKLADALHLYNLEGCLDPVNMRVVFTVNFNEGQKDGNCDVIQRFRWVRDQPGKSMFFVGGVHKESPIQNPELDAKMGNTAGWVPNQVRMYDDGTNGDAVAGDNIWTITFSMARGIRVGYKFTWGHRGDLWTGSEEWPGNQRILEVVDVNGDNLVYRADNFGDEATNKDLVNLYRRGNGKVTWDTDANGDGVPDARERKVDLDNDCMLDEWVTPTSVGPLTVDCESLGN